MYANTRKPGVPLGGLGTGSVELDSDGRLVEWQIFNNWGNWHCLPQVQMLARARSLSLEGAFFAVKAAAQGKEMRIRLLEKQSRAEMQGFGEIDYLGQFPMVHLDYRGLTLPGVDVSLSAFACFVPHDAQLSSIPAVGFIVTLANRSQDVQDVTVLFSAEHPYGKTAGCLKEGGAVHLRLEGDNGDLCATSLDENASCFFPQYALTSAAYISELAIAFRTGSNSSTGQRRMRTAFGAVLTSASLKPGEKRAFQFVLSWFFPETAYEEYQGHQYTNTYSHAIDVARDLVHNFAQILNRVQNWVNTIYSGGLPEYFRHLVGNSLSLYAKNSMWGKNRLFGLYESFECPSIDNLHVRYPGAVALPQIFPELEAQILTLHAKRRRSDGRLCEEFQPGGTRPVNVENPYNRDFADLFSCFALMIYRYVYWTGDVDSLRAIWPDIKTVFQYGKQRDNDNDGLPNRCAGNNTYDCPWWDCGDNMSYIASLWLGALAAGREMARLIEDESFARWCEDEMNRGQRTMQEKLFNGEFYALGETSGRRIDACMVDAMSGQWGANLSRLGYLVPKESLHSHIRSVFALNGADSRFGATNSVFRNGRRDVSDQEARDSRFAESIHPGPTFAFASLAIQEGFVGEGMALIKRAYDTLINNPQCGIWNMVDVLDPDTGLPHEWAFTYYLRSGSIWGALEAITGFRYNGILKEIYIAPPSIDEPLEAAFVTPRSSGALQYTNGSIRLNVTEGELEVTAFQIPGNGEGMLRLGLVVNGTAVPIASVAQSGDATRILLRTPMALHAGDYVSLARM